MYHCLYFKSGVGAIFTAIKKFEAKYCRSRLFDRNENCARKNRKTEM